MIFLGHCPDQLGLVARISTFFTKKNINILKLEEHAENGRFFIRVEGEEHCDIVKLEKGFEKMAKEIEMDFEFYEKRKKISVALFCSKTLHCPLEIISRQLSKDLNISIEYIVSNSNAIQKTAKKLEIPFFYTSTKNTEDEDSHPRLHEEEQLKILEEYPVDLVILGRYMKVISSDFLQKYTKPIINIHHSFLPSFIGANPYEMAYERGVKIIGATSHFVTKDLDEGPIIAQDILPVGHSLSVEELKRVGANIEKNVFAKAVEKYADHKIIEWEGRTVVFL